MGNKEEEKFFVALYLDEDFEIDLIDPLRARAYKVSCSRDEGMNEASDEEQLAFAARNRWVIVTHNVADFRVLHRRYWEQGKEHAGIIVSDRVDIGTLLRRLLNLLNTVTADEARSQLFFLQNFEH